jgi:hypothetical protein
VSSLSYGQEIIVDLDPDELIVASSPPFSVDFLNDDLTDFIFRVQTMVGDTLLGGQPSTYDGSSAIFQCLSGQPMGVTANGAFGLSNLSEGASVSSGDEFGLDTSYSLGINLLIDAGIGIFPYVYGNFLGVSNGYLGVRFPVGSDTHYGWIELSVSAQADTIIVHSYGYNATPEESVDAGDVNSISFTQDDGIRIWNNGKSLHVDLDSDCIGSRLSLISFSGQELLTKQLVEVATKIDVSNLSSGMYLLKLCIGNQLKTKRLYIH